MPWRRCSSGCATTTASRVVIIEHDLGLLQAVADRIVALDVGAVIADGPPSEVVRDPAVVAAYVGHAP